MKGFSRAAVLGIDSKFPFTMQYPYYYCILPRAEVISQSALDLAAHSLGIIDNGRNLRCGGHSKATKLPEYILSDRLNKASRPSVSGNCDMNVEPLELIKQRSRHNFPVTFPPDNAIRRAVYLPRCQ